MNWVLEITERRILSPSDQQYFLFHSPPPPLSSSTQSSGFNLNDRVSPSLLLIIIILAIIFFISGLLHFLVRFLLRPQSRDPYDMEDGTAFQGQLQQLFHLHDAGVDQSFIDTLPIFNYKAIIGVKDPFDCAVCLCEFEAEDKLRLLPKCSHAFHMDCIDTWLLSHSTCPLCRASLLPDFQSSPNFSPIVLVLESGGESSREIVSDREVARVSSHLSTLFERDDFKLPRGDLAQNTGEIQVKDDDGKKETMGFGEKVLSVKLGKFRNLDNEREVRIEDNSDARRCFSMGSFAYVMDGNSSLLVPIRTSPTKRLPSKKPCIPLEPCHRSAMSECGFDSRTEFNGLEAFRILEIHGNDEKGTISTHESIGGSKKESFSVSKIWLRERKNWPNGGRVESSSRRAFSFRFPINLNTVAVDEYKQKNCSVIGDGARRTISEIGISRWRNGGRELGCEDEIQSCNSLDSGPNAPSFARRTLLWLMGKQNRGIHSYFPQMFSAS